MSSNEAIKLAVQAGLGLGILSLQTLEMELALKRLVVLEVEGFPIMRHWYIVHRADKRLSPAAQAFKEFVLGPALPAAEPPPRLLPSDSAVSKPTRHTGCRAARQTR